VTTPVVEARGLEKRFGRSAALRGLDLELQAGSTLAVLGPNGAGKSTLLRLMAGLARPSAGRVRVAGVPADRREARARIGLVADASFLYPQLTARENLIFAARLHGLPHPGARADALLADEGLAPVAHRRAGAFSRGMAQRLSIARGLVHDPELMLLDEPFSGLDRGAADRLAARLGRLRDGGHAVVLVTHDFARAAQLADQVVVLAGGRVVHAARGGGADAALLERAYLEASAP
jgi:heme exporter protein A